MVINNYQFSRSLRIIGAKDPTWVIRYVYYAFIFSIPFEMVNAGSEESNFSLAKIAGFIFIMSTPLQPRLCFKFPPGVFWCFALHLYIYAILGYLQNSEFTSLIISQLCTLIQMLLLFWISYNLMRYEQVSKGTLVALAASCILLSFLQVLGFTGEIEANNRASVFGENPNVLGTVLSLGLLVLLGLAHSRKEIALTVRLFLLLCYGILGITIIRSGSRGAIVALMLSLLIFLLHGRDIRYKIKSALIILLIGSALSVVSYQIDFVRERWESTFIQGDTAGRDKIFDAAWELYLEKPWTGWGPVHNLFELGARLGLETRNPHNSYLMILTETGLLGAIPFFVGIWLCWRAAWEARGCPQGVLPVALMFFFLVVNVKGTYITDKFFWIVLAYALASGNSAALLKRRKISTPALHIAPGTVRRRMVLGSAKTARFTRSASSGAPPASFLGA